MNYIIERITVSPTVSAAAYGNGDQVGTAFAIPNICAGFSPAEILEAFYLDKGNTGVSISLLLFNQSVTIASGDNDALNISDSEMEKCIGWLAFNNTQNRVSTSANWIHSASDAYYAAPLWVMPHATDGVAGTIYGVVKSLGTPTYSDASDLFFSFLVKKHITP